MNLPPRIDAVLNFLFPEVCAVCGRLVQRYRLDCLCTDCWLLLERQRRSVAGHGVRSAGWYSGLLQRAIRLFKYRNRPGLALVLSQVLAADWLEAFHSEQWRVVAVPLHPSRLRTRGYNQAELLARHFSRITGCRFLSGALRRVRNNPPQAGLSERQRYENVRGAFAVTRGADIAGCDVVLVDDVITTGATVAACAELLAQSGARRIEILSLARAPRW